MSETRLAKTTGTAIMLELTTGERALLVEIQIDCPDCGTYRVRFGGHHLRSIRDLLIEFIDLHPELTGPDPQKGESHTWAGRLAGDPERN